MSRKLCMNKWAVLLGLAILAVLASVLIWPARDELEHYDRGEQCAQWDRQCRVRACESKCVKWERHAS